MRSIKGHWLITGASSGLGRALAVAVLERGGRVTATARDTASLADLAGSGLGAIGLDLAEPGDLAGLIARAEDERGDIDVLVNSAGLGFLSSIEGAAEVDIRRLFNINFFGLVAVTQAVLPGMRLRRQGAIVNISSIAGVRAVAGSGYYAASKHAVEGLSDALRQEVEPLGITVLVVQPAAFRSAFLGSELQSAEAIADYSDILERRRTRSEKLRGAQPGDPARAAEAIIAALEQESPPARLPLGGAAVPILRRKLADQIAELEQLSRTAAGCDYADLG